MTSESASAVHVYTHLSGTWGAGLDQCAMYVTNDVHILMMMMWLSSSAHSDTTDEHLPSTGSKEVFLFVQQAQITGINALTSTYVSFAMAWRPKSD